MYCLVGERARTADKPYAALLVDVAGHDADLAQARADNTGAVGANKIGTRGLEPCLYAHHVQHGYVLCNADNKANARVCRFTNGVCRHGRGHKNHANVCPGLRHGLGHGIEYRHAQHALPALAGGAACHHVGSVSLHLLGVEHAFAASEALHQHSCLCVDEYAHAAPPAVRAAIL